MSLIPNAGGSIQNDTADGSYLLGGNFSNLYLYNGGTSYTWDTSKLDYIWGVQGWNMSAFSVGATDSFSCTHSNYVY